MRTLFPNQLEDMAMVQVERIELSSSDWQPDIIAVILHLLNLLMWFPSKDSNLARLGQNQMFYH